MLSTREFFENKFAKKLSEDPSCMASAGVRNQSIAVDIDGPSGGQWSFDFDDQGTVKMRSGAGADASCTILTNDKTFEGLLQGKVNVPMAFLMRKIKVKGETNLAVKLGMALQAVFLNK